MASRTRSRKKKSKSKDQASGCGCRSVFMILIFVVLIGGGISWAFREDLWRNLYLPQRIKTYQKELGQALGATSRQEVLQTTSRAQDYLFHQWVSLEDFQEVEKRFDRFGADGLSAEEAREILDLAKQILDHADRAR